jgi:hypothetical protein
VDPAITPELAQASWALLSGIYKLRPPKPGGSGHAYYGQDPDPSASSLPALF